MFVTIEVVEFVDRRSEVEVGLFLVSGLVGSAEAGVGGAYAEVVRGLAAVGIGLVSPIYLYKRSLCAGNCFDWVIGVRLLVIGA